MYPTGYFIPTTETRVTPQKKTMERCSYIHELKPMFTVLKIMGVVPFHARSTGVSKFKLSCPLMVYSVALHLGMVAWGVLTCRTRLEYIERVSPSFGTIMLEASFISVFIPLFLSPLTQWVEVNKKAQYLTDWATFEARYREVMCKPLELQLRRLVMTMLLVTLSISAVVVTFPYLSFEDVKAWFAVPFFYSLLLGFLNTCVWYVNGQALTVAARHLAHDLEEHVLSHDFNCPQKIADYRMLWLDLSKLTQEKGASMGFTYGAQVTGYFVEQVLALYGLLVNLKAGLSLNNMVFVASALIFSWLIFITCNAAQQTTQEVGMNVQERLQKLCYKFPRNCEESKGEMRLFVETIVENPPVVNFSGFVVVNRGLQTSMMSAMVTYLVVLIQFQLSSQATSGKNSTSDT